MITQIAVTAKVALGAVMIISAFYPDLAANNLINMKGQISLEFLIVLAIFLAMLAVSITALVNVKDVGEAQMEEQRARMAAQEIANTINNICILGNGNSRSIETGLNNFTLEYLDTALRLTYEDISAAEEVLCPFDDGEFSNKITISCCDEEKVMIEQRQ